MRFNFQFGKKQKSIWDYAFWSIVLFSLVGFLSVKLKISQDTIWRWIDQIQRELIRKNILPQDNPIQDNILNTPELLEGRIRGDVDAALRDYERWESSIPPRMTNKTILDALRTPRFSDTQRLVIKDAIYYECPEGVMGIRGAWVDKDPNCH
jgi:hypothetical protein